MQIPYNDVIMATKAEVFPFSTALITEEHKREAAQAPKNPLIGKNIESKGIFAGVLDIDGRKFNLFAAPENLTNESNEKVLLNYSEAAKEVASKKNWHGHDGGNFENATAIYNALKDGSGVGKWFIPTKEMLIGTDLDGKKVCDDNLYDNKNNGRFNGTFPVVARSSGVNWYMSSSENPDNPSQVWFVRFGAGDGNWIPKNSVRMSCRPCRAEEVKQSVHAAFG